MHLWLRHETRATERRAPLTPADAAAVISAGHRLTVESSPQRIFGDDEYAQIGAEVAPALSWTEAPENTVVLGLKELPDAPAELAHRHVFFGHAYKGQSGATALLERFRRGGGTLLDVEYLTKGGRRVVAFGYWAGYVGASLAMLHTRGALTGAVQPMERAELDERLRGSAADTGEDERYLVTGSRGRSGSGALDAIAVGGGTSTGWDREETAALDKDALLAHDVLVNCVGVSEPAPPFVTAEDLDRPDRRLRTLSDVTADFTSDLNLLPVNDRETTWAEPVRRLHDGAHGTPPVDIVAIDNLPSLLPREASTTFSADLLPHLLDLPRGTEPWRASREVFEENLARLG
ncbi:saccharopine dehydrogenase (NAD+, L-lysine-forming) [Marihabitans asiaticum]|uniref:Saccharopine dehydrogenase [NAD(+), L-lysine-forming] n=2 Tax=Marihabitans asiaticum TaxID=415218 RepID=A0A560W887_9MICO|nr:saccharopine dehydrogenase (NAD+, L-lysine-forming) [Marihabitans asiaticum]